MKAHRIVFVATILFVSELASAQSWQDYKAEGAYSFAEVKAAVQRVTSLHLYSGWDEKAFSRAGDMTAVAILQTLSDTQLSNPESLNDLLEIIRAAFSCPSRCVRTVADREPRVTLLLLDYLRRNTNGQAQSSIDETKRLIMQQATQEKSDCRPIPVINNGVCRDKNGNDCSKEESERSPKLCEAPDPQYTAEAQKAHIKGTVLLSFGVNNDGCAENIHVIRGLGYGLNEAAVSAVERYRWQKRQTPIAYATMELNFDPQYHSTKAPDTPKCSEKHSDSVGSQK